MHIDSATIYQVRVPLVASFSTAYGSDDAIESVFVRLESNGSYGWGEAQPFRCPTYSPEYSAAVFMTVRDVFAAKIVGSELDSGDTLQKQLAPFKGNPFAKGVLDMAWWDLHAKLSEAPLWKVIGGSKRPVDVGADFGIMGSIDALLAEVGVAVQNGYKRIKLKFARDWGVEMVEAVREAFPQAVIHVDCNSAFTLDDLPMFQRLDRFGLAMIEQPLAFDDLIDHALLQTKMETPICLDESITSPARARKAISLGACRWINIKPGRVGGLTSALQIYKLCQESDVRCWIGGMLETGVGGSFNLALATLPNIRYSSDIFPTNRFFAKDLAKHEMVLSAPGQMTPRDAVGIGTEPNGELLCKGTLQEAIVRA